MFCVFCVFCIFCSTISTSAHTMHPRPPVGPLRASTPSLESCLSLSDRRCQTLPVLVRRCQTLSSSSSTAKRCRRRVQLLPACNGQHPASLFFSHSPVRVSPEYLIETKRIHRATTKTADRSPHHSKTESRRRRTHTLLYLPPYLYYSHTPLTIL